MLRFLCVAPKHGGRKFAPRSNMFLSLSLSVKHTLSPSLSHLLSVCMTLFMSLCLSVSLSLSLQLSFGYEFQFEFGFELKVDFDWIVPTLVPNLVTVPGCAHPACAIWGEPSMESKKHPLPDNSFAYLRYATVVFRLPCVFSPFWFSVFISAFFSVSVSLLHYRVVSFFWLLCLLTALCLCLCVSNLS